MTTDLPPESPTDMAGMPLGAVFFDGKSSRKRLVILDFGEMLAIMEDGIRIAVWPYADIRHADSHPGVARFKSVSGTPLSRLVVTDRATIQRIEALGPMLDAHRPGRGIGRIVGWSLAAIVSIIVVAVFGVPLIAERLTPLVPYAFERRVGDIADSQVRRMFYSDTCSNPAGEAAFAKMVEKIRAAGGYGHPLRSDVLGSGVANAIALPGGHIYLFRGLLAKANTVDEIAGVIAHEIGHAHHRDHMRAMLQNGGTSFLLGLLFGDITGAGAVVFMSRTLFDTAHSRDAETAADDYAIAVMHRLGRSPVPMGELLSRIDTKAGDGPLILSSHPLTADRLARMKAADRPASGPPILSDAEWTALKAICPPSSGKTNDKPGNIGGSAGATDSKAPDAGKGDRSPASKRGGKDTPKQKDSEQSAPVLRPNPGIAVPPDTPAGGSPKAPIRSPAPR